MLRMIVRGAVAALLLTLAVGVPPAANAADSTAYYASEAQAEQREADMDSVEAANEQVVLQDGQLDYYTTEYLVSMVPAQVYADYPVLDDLIRGADPYALGVVSYSGATIPGCPAAGQQLLAGFPGPYGHYNINVNNNWCTPNGPDNGCSNVRDNGLTFDFRAACRQHDLAYRWAAAPRFTVDLQLLKDFAADCAKRNIASRELCFARAGVYYAFVAAFGFTAYGNSEWPGYNRPIPATGIPALPAAATCLQSSHARLHTPNNATTMSRGTVFNMTGVVRRHNRVRFEFYDGGWNLVASHLTYFSDNNCVVRHEPETFNTNRLPVGSVHVVATYAAWEHNTTVRQHITSLWITDGGGSTRCNQASHARVNGGNNLTLTQGSTVYLTGVVRKYSRITFNFYDANGNWVAQHVTQPARDNCVVHHEPEWFSTWRLPVGTNRVDATYLEWETDRWFTRQVATLNIVEPPPPPPPSDDPPYEDPCYSGWCQQV